MQFARGPNRLLEIDNQPLDTANVDDDSDMKREAKQKLVPRMAKVCDCLEMWQSSQNLYAIHKEPFFQIK